MHSNVSFETTTPEAWNERGDEDVTIFCRRKTERKKKREKVRRNDNTKKIVYLQRREKI